MVVQLIIAAGIPVLVEVTARSALARERFPTISPEEILRTAAQVQSLVRRGLEPVFTPNPFTGGTILSTRDQRFALEIAGTLAERAFFALTPGESAELFDIRQRFISSFPGARPETPLPAAPPLPFPEEEAVQAAFENPVMAAAGVMRSISCTSRATTLDELALCQGGI